MDNFADVYFKTEMETARKERDKYRSLAECECGKIPNYPAHGWSPHLCPECQADGIEQEETEQSDMELSDIVNGLIKERDQALKERDEAENMLEIWDAQVWKDKAMEYERRLEITSGKLKRWKNIWKTEAKSMDAVYDENQTLHDRVIELRETLEKVTQRERYWFDKFIKFEDSLKSAPHALDCAYVQTHLRTNKSKCTCFKKILDEEWDDIC